MISGVPGEIQFIIEVQARVTDEDPIGRQGLTDTAADEDRELRLRNGGVEEHSCRVVAPRLVPDVDGDAAMHHGQHSAGMHRSFQEPREGTIDRVLRRFDVPLAHPLIVANRAPPEHASHVLASVPDATKRACEARRSRRQTNTRRFATTSVRHRRAERPGPAWFQSEAAHREYTTMISEFWRCSTRGAGPALWTATRAVTGPSHSASRPNSCFSDAT